MKKEIVILLLCFLIISCKGDIQETKEVLPPLQPEELIVPKVDSVAIRDSIARIDSIARRDSLAQIKNLEKASKARKKVKKEVPKIVDKSESPYKSLIFNVELGINPSRKNWVLFKNGTYVIFPDGYTREQMKNAAIKLVRSYDRQIPSVQKSNLVH